MHADTLTRLLVAASILILLQACGGGSDTMPNPFLGGGDVAYQGPPAATDDVRAFENNVWNNLRSQNRCGQCHASGGQSPHFVDETNINSAYSAAVPLVNLAEPASSLLVTKVAGGHNCWEPLDNICADTIENMISAWAGEEDGDNTRSIELTAPSIRAPGESKSFPPGALDNGASSFEQTIYPLLTEYCSACHYEEGAAQQQSPFFGNPHDVDSSYAAAKAKINIDTPLNSRFVQRLLEGHNCWSDCGSQNISNAVVDGDSGTMLDAIEQFANAIQPTAVDQNLVISKAMQLYDGIIATGGNRHESNLVALWEFKAGSGTTAFDTSGIEPSVNLSISGNVEWLSAYGLDFSGGKAQADTQTSRKLHDFIKSTGEYAIEAWLIPANVTQEEANIISYDAGATQKNFTLAQTLYSYKVHNRSSLSDTNGTPVLSTQDAGELLQSSLQHVVANYDPINGRSIFINGELIDVADTISQSTSISGWDDTYALVMGQSVANNQTWEGQIRMAAIHNRVLSAEQVLQNYQVGVGEKYFLLFSISEQIGIEDSYILFEVSQFDSYSYLFEQPRFVNLNPDWSPQGFAVRNLRIGINGKQALAGQVYANLDVTIDSSYSADQGQLLSPLGTVIGLEKGAASDEFFLSFEVLANQSNPFVEPTPIAAVPGEDADAVSEIGVRTFEEIVATISKITQVPVTNTVFSQVFQQYRQQLPTVETIDAFLSSHQMAIAQLALTACSERVDADAALPLGDPARALFRDFDFEQNAPVAFDTATERNNSIDPVLERVLMINLSTQPDADEIKNLLAASADQTLLWNSGSGTYTSLVNEMLSCPTPADPHYNEDFVDRCSLNSDATTGINTTRRTREIVKALCAATVGSAAMLLQ